jgi:hypothetical protein
MVESARMNEMRNNNNSTSNRHGNNNRPSVQHPPQRSANNNAASYAGNTYGTKYYNDYYNNVDDEPLDNYYAVQDAETVAADRSYGGLAAAGEYYTETYPYDGRLTPDNIVDNDDDDDFEIMDEDDSRVQAAAEHMDYARQNQNNQRGRNQRGAAGGGGDYDDDEIDYKFNSKQHRSSRSGNAAPPQAPQRPKTGHKSSYNVDSSYYLDDPNYD